MKRKMKNIRTKTNNFLRSQGIEHSEIQWMIKLYIFLVLVLTSIFGVMFAPAMQIAYLIGALLTFLNFFVLARTVPKLIFVRKGAVFSLLTVYYLRLMFTALILFVAIAGVKLPVISLLIGLSTLLITFIIWFGKYLVKYKKKEAVIDVS